MAGSQRLSVEASSQDSDRIEHEARSNLREDLHKQSDKNTFAEVTKLAYVSKPYRYKKNVACFSGLLLSSGVSGEIW